MAARVICIRLSCRGRVEYFDLDGSDAVLGRGVDADLSIDHPSIIARHARVLVRRGRLILAELGGLVALRGDRLRAATTLREGETFRIGDVEASAWTRDPSMTGRSIEAVALTAELDPIAVRTRRYEAMLGGRRAEATVIEPSLEKHEIRAWRTRVDRSAQLAPVLIAQGEVEGRHAIAERVPAGIRLSSLIESLRAGRIAISREVALAVLRRLAESLCAHHAIGPHAGLVPESVHLTLDGDCLLLRAGPRPMDPTRDATWCSENRRMNLPPSIGDDAFALMRIGAVLGGAEIASELADAETIRTRGAFEEWAARLIGLSDRFGVDPSAAHVARVVRLLADRGRPLGSKKSVCP